jgi:hypothetical protein
MAAAGSRTAAVKLDSPAARCASFFVFVLLTGGYGIAAPLSLLLVNICAEVF